MDGGEIPVISSAGTVGSGCVREADRRASIDRLVDCTGSGIFIATAPRWQQPHSIDPETVAYIEETITQLDLPKRSQLLVFSWVSPSPSDVDRSCGALHELLSNED